MRCGESIIGHALLSVYQNRAHFFTEKARCLLENYVATPWMRFFTGHWNRHHIEDVQKIIDKLLATENPISNLEQLLEQLYAIKLTNPLGSLARRISFIEYEIAANEEEMLSLEQPLIQH